MRSKKIYYGGRLVKIHCGMCVYAAPLPHLNVTFGCTNKKLIKLHREQWPSGELKLHSDQINVSFVNAKSCSEFLRRQRSLKVRRGKK
jgi:hypothetical protein